ncbi:expressed unknown protein [Seminavis robusta]|uniref:Uncharacterized protein n=1 Tax=Seminavis robusta TaxID=568900 RepID=A0A9N8DPR6_9STRA|nr:expressed unknown protein [Seminavis robusta]|eukprot:Sro198_g084210.1 n/a (150) ;mRNA; f:86564-87013
MSGPTPAPPPTSSEITQHADARDAGAPKPILQEMLSKKSALRETGIDKTHLGCVRTTKDGKVSYQQTELDPAEQESLAKIYDDCSGDPDKVAAAVPPEYGVSSALLKQKPPPNSKVFAAQCVEGAYHLDEASGETSDKASLVSRLPQSH